MSEVSGRAIFVGATDTGVGKTLISGLLVDYLRRRGIGAGYRKWVATGCPVDAVGEASHHGAGNPGAPPPEDWQMVMGLLGGENFPLDQYNCPTAHQKVPLDPADESTDLDLVVPYRFSLPASPHLAAEQEGQEIDPKRVKQNFTQALAEHELVVVEGVGGLMVPLNRRLLLIDLVAQLKIPVLLVIRSGLGTINHTLLSLEALRRREIPLLGLVASDETQSSPELIINDNLRTLAQLGQAELFGRLPRCPDAATARAAFAPIGEAFLGGFSQ